VQQGIFKGREPYTARIPEDNRQGQIDLLTSFDLGETSHKLLFMMDGSRGHYRSMNWQMQTADRNKLPTAVRNVDPTSPDDSFFAHDDLTRNTGDKATNTDMLGFLASERATLASGRLLLFGSVRLDRQKVEYHDFLSPKNDATKNTTQTSYSVGGNWHVLGDKIVLFANTSTAFDPQTQIDRGTGELQDNITAEGFELGAKGDIVDKKIYWMATAYQIDRSDIPQKNPAFIAGEDGEFPPGVSEFIGTGVERSKGLELELFGDVTENLSFTLAVGRMDCYTKESSDDPASVGVKLLRIPDLNWGATTRYRFATGPLKGLSTGVAARFTGSYIARYGTFGSEVTGTGDITNNLVLNYGPSNRIEEVRPDTTLASFFVNYSFSTGKYRHTVGFYVNNLFDEEWWTVTGRVGVGREFRVNYGLHF
jgi:outer membrane receptor for ferric coprogen and ferric-rhodotorulic acid